MAFVDVAEPVRPGDGDEVTAVGIGPCVERATETDPIAAAVRNPCAPRWRQVLAKARKRPSRPGSSGSAGRSRCPPSSCRSPQVRGQAHEERGLAEEDVLLLGQQFGRCVVRKRLRTMPSPGRGHHSRARPSEYLSAVVVRRCASGYLTGTYCAKGGGDYWGVAPSATSSRHCFNAANICLARP